MNKQILIENIISYHTLVRREIVRFLRIWIQTLIPPIITTSLYFLIFGSLIGERIGNINGFRYIEFIAPGIIMMSTIMNSYSNVASSFFSSKFHRSIEEQLIASIPNYLIILGFVTAGMFRGLLTAFLISIVAMVFSGLEVKHIGLTISMVVLSALLFSLIGFINGLFARSFDDVTIIPNFILAPLTYLGGVFYSISMLPENWQSITILNPLLYIIDGFRYAILGVSDISFAGIFSILIILIIFLFICTIYLMRYSDAVRA